MGHNWIVDVIVDLRTFAERNDLPNLAEELNKAALIAASEIDQDGDATQRAWSEDTETGRLFSQA